MRKGKLKSQGDNEITGTGVIPKVTENMMYRYLGVLQVFKENQSHTCKTNKEISGKDENNMVFLSECQVKGAGDQPLGNIHF